MVGIILSLPGIILFHFSMFIDAVGAILHDLSRHFMTAEISEELELYRLRRLHDEMNELLDESEEQDEFEE